MSTTPFPRIAVYPWSSGFGTRYADPATPTGNVANGVAFGLDGADIAVVSGGTPSIAVYPWASGFGTRYADPATLPALTISAVTFG